MQTESERLIYEPVCSVRSRSIHSRELEVSVSLVRGIYQIAGIVKNPGFSIETPELYSWFKVFGTTVVCKICVAPFSFLYGDQTAWGEYCTVQ